ncbi:MAG: DNA-binding PadR family transcriptional regulator [Natronomonas sp.]|jgi:DNA-binding PadR family transcriptional regulator
MSSQRGPDATLQSLIGELNGMGQSESSEDPAVRTEAVVRDASTELFDDGTPTIDDGLIKESLPELLMLLVGLREGDTHGKGVMEDLNRFFGAQLSPGTVYPMLHDLDEEGLLEMRELVQTKEYAIDDGEAVRNELHEAMTQHLALGMVFHRALDELDAADD